MPSRRIKLTGTLERSGNAINSPTRFHDMVMVAAGDLIRYEEALISSEKIYGSRQ